MAEVVLAAAVGIVGAVAASRVAASLLLQSSSSLVSSYSRAYLRAVAQRQS